jgi:predicted metal-binding protein
MLVTYSLHYSIIQSSFTSLKICVMAGLGILVAHACNPSYSGRDQEDHSLKPALENSLRDPILKYPTQKGWRVAQAVECLCSKCEALCSNTGMTTHTHTHTSVLCVLILPSLDFLATLTFLHLHGFAFSRLSYS